MLKEVEPGCVTGVRDTTSNSCNGCQMGPRHRSGADGSGFASQSYHNDLEQGITSPSLQMSLLHKNSITACTDAGYIICLCFIFLESQKVRSSICVLTTYT